MMPMRSNIGERPQHERSLMRSRMRQYDAPGSFRVLRLPVADDALVTHNIEVERPGPPLKKSLAAIFRLAAPSLCLNPLQD